MEPDVEHYIREACHKKKNSFKRVVNDALRESLQPKTSKLALLAPRPMVLVAGVDSRRLSQLDPIVMY